MTDKGKVILKGLIALSDSEREEVLRELSSYRTKTFSERQTLNENLEKAQRYLGPTSSTSCPCCGR